MIDFGIMKGFLLLILPSLGYREYEQECSKYVIQTFDQNIIGSWMSELWA